MSRMLLMIKIFGADVDGTLTDGGVYYSDSGEKSKRFNVKDGMGFELLRERGITTFLITKSTCKSIEYRRQDIAVDFYLPGVIDKAAVIADLLSELKLTWEELAYIGDDINDLPVIEKAGVSGIPADSLIEDINADYICARAGGYGCVREFADLVIRKNTCGVPLLI